jgi:hypothetical protein
MIENFDCTQFITFDLISSEATVERLLEPFKYLGFELVFDFNIRQVKRDYFKQYINQCFVELKDDNFMGEFEDWVEQDSPPRAVRKFIEEIEVLLEIHMVKNVRIMLTFFAEEGTTTIENISVSRDDIKNGLFSMSKHNFEVWTDNLVLGIL